MSLPKSLPDCSLHMPSRFISCYCFPELPPALHDWKQCFEVSLRLWVSPLISVYPDSRNPGVILSSQRVAPSKWAETFGVQEWYDDLCCSGPGMLLCYPSIYLPTYLSILLFWRERIFSSWELQNSKSNLISSILPCFYKDYWVLQATLVSFPFLSGRKRQIWYSRRNTGIFGK